jgi:hypothetical protein
VAKIKFEIIQKFPFKRNYYSIEYKNPMPKIANFDASLLTEPALLPVLLKIEL